MKTQNLKKLLTTSVLTLSVAAGLLLTALAADQPVLIATAPDDPTEDVGDMLLIAPAPEDLDTPLIAPAPEDPDTPLISPAPEDPDDIAPIAPAPGYRDENFKSFGQYDITVNGKTLAQQACTMVPLRAVAEALGYTVTWNGSDKPITVDDGVMHTEVTLGEDQYFVVTSDPELEGMSAPFSLGVPPYCVEGVTYVPIGLFEALEGNVEGMFRIQDGQIVIDTTNGE